MNFCFPGGGGGGGGGHLFRFERTHAPPPYGFEIQTSVGSQVDYEALFFIFLWNPSHKAWKTQKMMSCEAQEQNKSSRQRTKTANRPLRASSQRIRQTNESVHCTASVKGLDP